MKPLSEDFESTERILVDLLHPHVAEVRRRPGIDKPLDRRVEGRPLRELYTHRLQLAAQKERDNDATLRAILPGEIIYEFRRSLRATSSLAPAGHSGHQTQVVHVEINGEGVLDVLNHLRVFSAS